MFALLHTLLLFFHTDAVSRGEAPLFASAAGLGLLLGAVGRQMRLGRIAENFRFVSYQGDKYAAHRVEDPQSAVEIGRSAVALGEPEVAYFKKADFLERFLENSYGDDGSDRAMRIFVPLALLASLLLGAGCLLLKKADWWGALAVGVGTFCLASPGGGADGLQLSPAAGGEAMSAPGLHTYRLGGGAGIRQPPRRGGGCAGSFPQ